MVCVRTSGENESVKMSIAHRFMPIITVTMSPVVLQSIDSAVVLEIRGRHENVCN